MNFECLLLSAKAGNEDAITASLQMYRPLLLKYAIIDGVLDEDFRGGGGLACFIAVYPGLLDA